MVNMVLSLQNASELCLRRPGKGKSKIRRLPTLPGGLPPSTIGAGGLNYCVRNGNRCDPSAIATGKSVQLSPRMGLHVPFDNRINDEDPQDQDA